MRAKIRLGSPSSLVPLQRVIQLSQMCNAYHAQDQMPTIVKATIQTGALPGTYLSYGGLAAA